MDFPRRAAAGAKRSILVAYDASGSTGNCAHYHTTTQEILGSLPADVPVTFLFWDSGHRVITRAELDAINKKRTGYGGTDPSQIARFVVKTGFHGDLVIVTDGQAEPGSSDSILGGWRFESVTAHLIGPRGSVNMSITCPFTRASPHAVHHYEPGVRYRDGTVWTRVTAEDFAATGLIASITSEAAFTAAFPAIERSVIARLMGTPGDSALRDSLLAMKKRVVAASAAAAGGSAASKALDAALAARDTAAALAAAGRITEEYYAPEDEAAGGTFGAKVSRLVSMCEGALRRSFDLSAVNAAIHSDRVRRAGATSAAPAEGVPLTEPADPALAAWSSFTCPVLLDECVDIIVLLASDGPAVLEGLDKAVVKSLLDCPLNALGQPEVVDRIKAMLDHPVSLRAFKSAAESGHPFDASPMTRRPVRGGLCLGLSEEHCRATTWALDQAITGGKRIGNADLWFAVVWQLVESGGAAAWLPRAAVEAMRAQMAWRLQHHTSFIALTGDPVLPTTRVPLATAVWYVYAASALNAGPKREAMRAHIFHEEPLRKLLDLSGLADVLPPGVDDHVRRLKALMTMLSWVKRSPHHLPMCVAALTHRCLRVKGSKVSAAVRKRETRLLEMVPVDGAPSAEQVTLVRSKLPAAIAACPVVEIVALAGMVDPSKSMGGIALDFSFPSAAAVGGAGAGAASVAVAGACATPAMEWDHVYGPDAVARFVATPVTVNVHTCRPQYSFPDGTWFERASVTLGVRATPGRIISFHKLFGLFVKKYGAYPSFEDYTVFVANRLVVHGKHRTLPAAFETLARQTLSETVAVQALLTAAEFVKRWDACVATKDRVEIEAAAVARTSADAAGLPVPVATRRTDAGATVTAGVTVTVTGRSAATGTGSAGSLG